MAHWHAAYPWRMTVIAVLITVILGGFASQLTITMRTQDLLPEGNPQVDQFNRIVDEFSTATSIIVVVQGEESRIKFFADDLAPRILELMDGSQNLEFQEEIEKLQNKLDKLKNNGNRETKISELESEIAYLKKRIDMSLFQRVDYKAETDFLKEHALMLIEADDLKDTKDLFTDPNLTGLITNINNSI